MSFLLVALWSAYVLIELEIPGNALQGVIFGCPGHFSAF